MWLHPTSLPLTLPCLHLRLLHRLNLLLLLHRLNRLMFRPHRLLPPSLTIPHPTSTLSGPVTQTNPISPPSTPSGHPLPTYAIVVADSSTPPPPAPASNHINSVQQAYRALDHRKLWTVDCLPVHPNPAFASSRFTICLVRVVEYTLDRADPVTGPRSPAWIRGWEFILQKILRRALENRKSSASLLAINIDWVFSQAQHTIGRGTPDQEVCNNLVRKFHDHLVPATNRTILQDLASFVVSVGSMFW